MKKFPLLTAFILALVLAIGPSACATQTGNATKLEAGDGAQCEKKKHECEGEEGAEGRVCPHKKKEKCPGGEACGDHADCPGGDACMHEDCPYKKKCKGKHKRHHEECADGAACKQGDDGEACAHKKKKKKCCEGEGDGEGRMCPHKKKKCEGAPEETAEPPAGESAPAAQ